MADLLLSVTAADVGSSASRALRAVAAAFDRHGVGHPLADAHRSGAGWLTGYRAEPVVVRATTRYSADLERGIEELVLAAAPGATLTVEWDPPAPERDAYAGTGPAVYRLAELFAALDDGAPLGRVGRGLLDPARDTGGSWWMALAQAPRDLLYDALGEASALAGVDWRATRTEAADAIGGLRILPTGERTVAGTLPGFAGLRAGWAALDRADVVGDQVADDERPVWSIPPALAAALPGRLLRLDNGDTAGFLAVTPDLADEVLARAAAAGIPLTFEH